MGRTALLVADMLNDFIDPQGSLYIGEQGREIIPFIQRKIAEVRTQGDLVVFLCDTHAPDDREFKYFKPHAVRGAWGAQIIPELERRPGDHRVEKYRYNPFYQTELEAVLRQEQVDKVQVVGVCTSICVLQAVSGLFDRDIPVVVYKDGVADFDPEAHAFALKHMKRVMGAEVV
jgi:nicotinamidase-related amidase